MFKIVTFTDVHLADVGPISRKDNYRDTILNKLEQISDFCFNAKVDLAICGGDLFNLKNPTKNSHYLVSQVIDIFKGFPCPVHTIYGNHDLRQDNISTMPRQPFNTVIRSGACKLITDELLFNGQVRLFGVDFLKNPEYSDFNRISKGEKIQICVSHVNASSKFTDLFGERVYSYEALSKTTSNVFVFGHYHPDQDIEIHNNKHFINVGSLSRGSLKKDELGRIPAIGYIEIDEDFNIKSEKIKLNALASEEIFNLELKEKEEKEQEEIQKFITELKTKIDVTKTEDISEKIKSLNFEKSIIDKALEYYERAI